MCVMLFNMCAQNPQTRQACMTDHHIWLYPELVKGWELYTGEKTPYQEEKDKLNENNPKN